MLKTEMGRLILREGKRRGVLKTEMGRLIIDTQGGQYALHKYSGSGVHL